MRILQLLEEKRNIFNALSGSNMGGHSKVAIELHDILSEDHEVLTNCAASDMAFGKKGLQCIGFDSGKRMSKDILISFIKNYKPEVIIVHSSERILSALCKESIQAIFIDHNGGTVHKLYREGYFTKTSILNKNLGGLNLTVSSYSKDRKEREVEAYWPGIFPGYDDWLNFQFFNEELDLKVIEGRGYITTVGRAMTSKNPHFIKDLHKKYGHPFKACVAFNPESEPEYFEKHIDGNENFLVNAPRSQIFDTFRNASVYFSTWSDESAGITAFEAFCLGIPVVLNTKKGAHASTMYIPDGEGTAWIYYDPTKDITEDLKRFMAYSLEEREAIARKAREGNSKEKLKVKLKEVLDKYRKNEFGDSVDLFSF